MFFKKMKAKKHLGQNFLKSHIDILKVISSANLSREDLVVEVGPGKGALTKEILKTGATILAFEKDAGLIPLLEERFKEDIKNKKLFILHKDIIEVEIEKEIKIIFNKKVDYKLIANIPYYITGSILRMFLEDNYQPKRMVLITQKEVAKRITDKEKSSILSISVNVFGEAKYIKTIKAKNFSPAPKVDSAILEIDNISKDFFVKNKIDEKDFFKFIKKCFQFKRKTLVKNLEKDYKKEKVMEMLKQLNFEQNIRGEDLKTKNFLDVYLSTN